MRIECVCAIEQPVRTAQEQPVSAGGCTQSLQGSWLSCPRVAARAAGGGRRNWTRWIHAYLFASGILFLNITFGNLFLNISFNICSRSRRRRMR